MCLVSPEPVKPSESDHRTAGGVFATTHWSVVLAAGQPDSPQAQAALEALCRAYWYPLYAYVRRRGRSPQDAQDLTQGFFLSLLRGQYLTRADRARGRFRTFLLTALENYLHNEHDRALALKRGGDREIVSWDGLEAERRYALEPAGGLSPEQLFEKRWGATLLEQVLARLRAEFDQPERRAVFDQLKPHLWGEDHATPYAELATRFNLSVPAIKVTVHRLRKRYRELLREAIAQTVADPGEIADEIRHLLRVTSE